jgi:hypothetical protein
MDHVAKKSYYDLIVFNYQIKSCQLWSIEYLEIVKS